MDIFENRPFLKLFKQLENQARIQSVNYLDDLDRESFHSEIFPLHYPTVFKSEKKPISKNEIINELEKLELTIDVRVGDYSNPDKYIVERKLVPTEISKYINENINSSEDVASYAGNFKLDLDLLDKIGGKAPCFYPLDEYEPPTCWLGGKSCITPLHKDGSKNFAVHLFGRKKWTLFPPRDAIYLYMERVLESSDFAPSKVNLNNIDHERFPDFKKAKSLTIEVEAGNTLYLPEGWGHFVENLEPTLMINYWHKNADIRG